jgi:hypothetical protein
MGTPGRVGLSRSIDKPPATRRACINEPTLGVTDEFGWHAVEGKVYVHDLHATILHLMGIDHTQLAYRYSGRHYRLTDVFGNVIQPILA